MSDDAGDASAPPPVETPRAEATTPPETPESIPEPETVSTPGAESTVVTEPAVALPGESREVPSRSEPTTSASPSSGTTIPENFPARGLAARRARQETKLSKIIDLAKRQEFITNDDVEKLLHISNATATRYLNTLAKSGKLQRIGNSNHAHYKLP